MKTEQRKMPENEPGEEEGNETTGVKGVENSRKEKSTVSTAPQRRRNFSLKQERHLPVNKK